MPRLSKIGAACLSAFGFGTGGANVVTADYLVVAGGGGGGGAGGGGGGGYQTSTTSLSLTQTYTVIVGAGGSGAGLGANTFGGNGTNSTFGALTASVGGGGGGSYSNTGANANGLSGGSGGGGGWANSGTVLGGSATSGQGYAGGTGDTTTAPYNSGGGGGAGAAGGNASGSVSGNGGAGASTSITGSSLYFSGGGGGGAQGAGSTAGNGGIGGGGGGANGYGGTTVGTGGGSSITSGLDGTTGGAGAGGYGGNGGANSGGGGGGMSISAILGGNGGSGVVIVRYLGAQQFGGGIVSSDGTYTIHTFKTSGQLVPMTPITASYLIVAGGAGAGGAGAGGGGAGGLLTSTVSIDTASTYIVTVGAGGTGVSSGVAVNGSNSTLSIVSTIAYGGGGGASWNLTPVLNGANGGSGGGAGTTDTTGSTGTAGTGVAGQGYAGGTSYGGPATGGSGGGGGAGGVGANGLTNVGGNGGVGVQSSITGTATYYAGGGGGATSLGGSTQGIGGLGGGGTASKTTTGGSGVTNTGGGGGGGGYDGTVRTGGNGGSGIVVISYAGTTQLMAGGTVTIVGGNVIHTFTSSGYLTPLTFVGRSLRFRKSATAYLSKAFTTTGNTTTFTWSSWVKRGLLGSTQYRLFDNGGATNTYLSFASSTADTLGMNLRGTGATNYFLETTAVFRDPAAWYHVVLAVDTTQATSTERAKLYINGVQQSLTGTYPAQNQAQFDAGTRYIGSASSGIVPFDGYMAEVRMIDGQALTPNSFGTFNSYGVWQPINYGGSYGTNGFYLPFSDTTSTTTLVKDQGPQGNNWTPNNISLTAGSTYDSMTDVPTLTSSTAANYAVLNPLLKSWWATPPCATPTNGNLTMSGTNISGFSTIAIPSTPTYFEITPATMGNTGTYSDSVTIAARSRTSYETTYMANGSKILNGTATSYGATWTSGDVIGVACDFANNQITFYKNGVSQGAITNTVPANEPILGGYYIEATISSTVHFNFGQRPFAYTPPSGFVALNTYNL